MDSIVTGMERNLQIVEAAGNTEDVVEIIGISTELKELRNFKPFPIPDCMMRVNEAIAYARENLEIESVNRDNLEELLIALQFLRVTVHMAISYMKYELHRTPNPVRDYLKLLRDRDPSPYAYIIEIMQAVWKTWSLSFFEKIAKTDSYTHAAAIVALVSCLDSKNIPISILAEMLEPSEHANVMLALVVLDKYSIFQMNDGVLNIDLFLHQVLRMHIPIVPNVLVACLSALETYVDSEVENSDATESLLPHAIAAWKCVLDPEYDELVREYQTFPVSICSKLGHYKKFDEMRRLAVTTFPYFERVLGPNNEGTIYMKYFEASALLELKKYPESLEIINEIYARDINGLRPETELKILVPYLLAQHFSIQGNRVMELEILRGIEAELIETPRGPEHKGLFMILYHKVLTLMKTGKFDEALKDMLRLLELEGEEGDSNFAIRMCIPKILMKKGDFQGALERFESLYESQKIILGEDHPETLETRAKIQDCKARLLK